VGPWAGIPPDSNPRSADDLLPVSSGCFLLLREEVALKHSAIFLAEQVDFGTAIDTEARFQTSQVADVLLALRAVLGVRTKIRKTHGKGGDEGKGRSRALGEGAPVDLEWSRNVQGLRLGTSS